MSGRELLEMAAKAVIATAIKSGEYINADDAAASLCPNGKTWNPLTDDGDALRLAVKLRMHVEVWDGFVQIFCEDRGFIEDFEQEIDAYAATRRAIVRAAAEIGRLVQP